MAKEPEAAATPEQPPQVKSRVLAQYIRDMSFENILAQKGVSGEPQPEISVQVNLDARKRNVEHQFEVITKLNVSSKSKEKGETLFIMEVEYAGIFHVEGLTDEHWCP